MADETEESILHMVNSDPNRTPTFTLFGDPTFYFEGHCASGVPPALGPGCPSQESGYAWNHGDIQPRIASTWQGWVGPGIEDLGLTTGLWTDHTDARPTLLTDLGLHDDYSWDGRAIAQILSAQDGALPATIKANIDGYERLSGVYKQLDAPFGTFGLQTLDADTHAIATTSPGDGAYLGMDNQLQACESKRQALLPAIQDALYKAESGQQAISRAEETRLYAQARALILDAQTLASSSTPPAQTVCS
jgi:hypothetical protein